MTRMVAFGDSILAGWDGHVNVAHDRRIPETIGKINGWDVDNRAIGGTQFGGNNSFVSKTAETNFFAFDIVLVGFGVNDWCYPGTLGDVKNSIQQGINNIHATNSKIPILFELPTQDFRNKSTSLDDKNSRGWTQNQLCELIIQEANDNGCKYYDWRTDPLITPENHLTTLGDGEVHPTQAVMDKMAQRLAPVLASMVKGDATPTTPVTPDHPTKPDDDHHNSGHGNSGGDSGDVKPVKIKCQLVMIDDPFKLGDNVNSNVKTIIDFINGIYKRASDVFGSDPKTVSLKTSYSNDLMRPLRNGVITTLIDLQHIVNDLIKFCNEFGFIDMMKGDTPLIEVDPPRMLTTDSDYYQPLLNAQWKLIEDTLNKLSGYLQEMEGED